MVSIIHGLENRENSLIYGCVNGLYINHYDKLHQKKKFSEIKRDPKSK